MRNDLNLAVGELQRLRTEADERKGELARVETQLETVDQALVDVRTLEAEARRELLAELQRRDLVEGQEVRTELERLEERVAALRNAAEEHRRQLELARQGGSDVEARYRRLMNPTVRINARHEVGSGTLVWSRRAGQQVRTYILSAWHIVQDDVEDGRSLEVDFYQDGELLRTESGKVVEAEIELDLVLVEVVGDHVYELPARLATPDEMDALRVFTPVYAIGCPLGYPPLPTSGEVTSLDKELDGLHFWMINAPTIFGNSGGGIYDATSNTLIGVLSRISAYKNMIDVAVPHMGLVMPLERVYQWLDTTRYGFVYRDRMHELGVEIPPVGETTLPASAEDGRESGD
jgi:S1-C subfamily serine protease